MIDLSAAALLLDFGASIGEGPRADEQLKGAVAIHNILDQQGVAYLADEVGMGKTYVALGALALFRHFNPEFRVLVIAPRENIQRKWIKELGNFCANNVRFPDLRTRSVRGGPARPMVRCDNLHSFVHEVTVDSRRDFFLRLTSFSFGLAADPQDWRRQRDNLRRQLPWLADEAFDLRSKEAFKDNYARAVCCALPVFDLVIVDEGHNLKHGFREGVAARNRMLALAMGHEGDANPSLFPRYGRRAKRVLFLSATPIEDSYVQLWNQLDVFGIGGPFASLKRNDVDDETKKSIVQKFLVRRVTTMRVNGKDLTKNQYRREWRQGGVLNYDEPIRITDPRKGLVVALVQKKVAELLGSGKFNMSFQIGMLASFESFLQTSKLKREQDDGNFDDVEQNRDSKDAEREGIDVRDVNRLSRHFYERFGYQMPHPKMDEVVESLATSWTVGRKTLVFVRRVASVKEIKQKLDEMYDKWLIPFVRGELPESVQKRFDETVSRYQLEKQEAQSAREVRLQRQVGLVDLPSASVDDDRGGTDTFFAWFFRGDGPSSVVSGANIQRRFIQANSAYSTFFERNHVAEVLDVDPGEVVQRLGAMLGLERQALSTELRARAARFLSGRARQHRRHDRFVAAQAAALELIIHCDSKVHAAAKVVYEQVYRDQIKVAPAVQAPDILDSLEETTFFSTLRRPEWSLLRKELWPEPPVADGSVATFRESELRARLLSATARLGHGLIDLYLLTIGRLKSLQPRTLDSEAGEGTSASAGRVVEYLARLETQRTTSLSQRSWAAFDELQQAAANFALILDTNAPEARSTPLSEVTRLFGTLLGQQQPVGGMSGEVNRTLVQQFRMPGYPMVLVTTDLLQEGEDLHTFCSAIHHYGISWTPSAMEQRTGRIDRVRSQSDRRLGALQRQQDGDDLLQVHFPYLQDTVEILQVERVLERMNVFLRLMHEGLISKAAEEKRVDVRKVLARERHPVEVIRQTLETAFPIHPRLLSGEVKALAITPDVARSSIDRFNALLKGLSARFPATWSSPDVEGQVMGTMTLQTGRIQPFTLFMDSLDGWPIVRCVSPVGVVGLDETSQAIEDGVRSSRVRIGAISGPEPGSYNLTVQEDVLLGSPIHDIARVEAMLDRVANEADQLELIHLPGEDRPLVTFGEDLRREGA